MKKIKILSLALALILVLTGCGMFGNDNDTQVENMETDSSVGSLIVSVNPRIKLNYDKNTLVTKAIANNPEGLEILDSLGNLVGYKIEEAVGMIVSKFGEHGYLVSDLEKETKEIVLELETGSILPNQDFIPAITAVIQKYINSGAWSAEASIDDLDESQIPTLSINNEGMDLKEGNVVNAQDSNSPQNRNKSVVEVGSNKKSVSLEEARAIALNNAGVSSSNATFSKAKKSDDDGVEVYEFEFYTSDKEYEYDIRVSNGAIVSKEVDNRTSGQAAPSPAPKNFSSTTTTPSTTSTSSSSSGSGSTSSGGSSSTSPSRSTSSSDSDYSDYDDDDDSDYDDSDYDDSDYDD